MIYEQQKNICTIFGEGSVAENIVRKWFGRLRNVNFDLEDRERSGRPAGVDYDQLETLLRNNVGYATRDIAEILNICHVNIARY